MSEKTKSVNTEEKNFETALSELSQIVERLENGNMPLDESLEAFEKGIGLVKICENRLNEAEQKITILTKDGGDYVERPFTESED